MYANQTDIINKIRNEGHRNGTNENRAAFLELRGLKQDLLDAISVVESMPDTSAGELISVSDRETLISVSERVDTLLTLKQDLLDVISSMEFFVSKSELSISHNELSNQVDELKESGVKKAVFNFADQPLTGTVHTAVSLPAGYVVRSCWYEVTETFTSDDTSPDSTTLKMSMESDGDIKAAVAISDGSNPYDVGFKETLVLTSTESSNVKMTEARSLTIEVTNGSGVTNGLTAGEMAIYVEYYKS